MRPTGRASGGSVGTVVQELITQLARNVRGLLEIHASPLAALMTRV